MQDSCRGHRVAANLDRAVDVVLNSRRSGSGSHVSVRMADTRYRIPPSTVQAAITRRRGFKKPAAPGKKRALTLTNSSRRSIEVCRAQQFPSSVSTGYIH